MYLRVITDLDIFANCQFRGLAGLALAAYLNAGPKTGLFPYANFPVPLENAECSVLGNQCRMAEEKQAANCSSQIAQNVQDAVKHELCARKFSRMTICPDI